MSVAQPTLSVVVPTFDRQPRLHRVLSALAAQDVDRGFEVIVVSDGSTDGTDAYLASSATPIPVLAARQQNQGPAAARNRGVSLASGDLIVFLDDDVVPETGLLQAHLDAHARLGDGAIVIGPMLDPPDHSMSPWIRYEQRMLAKQYDAMAEGHWQAGARQFYTGNVSLSRHQFNAAGGFDPRFRRMEDVELAYRLEELGARFMFDPAARGLHYAERSFESWLTTAGAYGRNAVIFGRDHGRQHLLDELCYEQYERHWSIRTVNRVCSRHARLAAMFNRGVRWSVTNQLVSRSRRLTGALLSMVYNLAYYQGAAAELGGDDQLRDLLRRGTRSRPVLLTVSGSIPDDIDEQVADGRRPRPDYLSMAEAFNADIVDHATAERADGRVFRALRRLVGVDTAVAWFCFRRRRRYDLIFTDGEQVGLPLAALFKLVRHRPRHFMIVHIMSPRKKVAMFKALRLSSRIDRMYVYASSQQRFLVERLGYDAERVVLTPFMVDTEFFSPRPPPVNERPMLCSAGLEFRDYPTLVDAVRGLEIRVVLAAASPWSKRRDTSRDVDLPDNVEVRRLALDELRDLYAAADLVVVPVVETDFQAGITTILEAMAMGKPLICTRTEGQSDTVVDGETGVYVPPGDPAALRSAIVRVLGDDALRARLGAAARRWAVEHAELDVYVRRHGRDVAQWTTTGR